MTVVLPGLLAFNNAFARIEFPSIKCVFAEQSYDCIDSAYSWQTVVRGGASSSPATEPSGEASSSGARRRRAAPAPPRSTNDQRIITYL